MSPDAFPRLARREIQGRMSALPVRHYRWGVVPLPRGLGEGQVLVIRGGKVGSGFDILVGIFPHGIEVACGKWHSHAWELRQWDDEEELCASFGEFLHALLSPSTRLVIESRRGRPCRWRLEFWGPDGWVGMEEVVAFHLPWGRREREVRQNALLPSPAMAWEAKAGGEPLHPGSASSR